jgi:ABC-type multidrug transport system fused ATPase/permease subunit
MLETDSRPNLSKRLCYYGSPLKFVSTHLESFMLETVTISAIAVLLLLAITFIVLRQQYQKKQQLRQECFKHLLRLKKLMVYFQYHRGLSARYLNGQTDVADELREKQRLIAQVLPSMALLARHSSLSEHWQSLLDHWQRLFVNNLLLTPEDNLEQHNRLIYTLLHLIEDVTELGYWSSRDHNKGIGSIVAILHTTEWIGQARALGSGMLAANKCRDNDQSQMHLIQAKLEHCLQQHSSNKESLSKLFQLNEIISQTFLQSSKNSKALINSSDYFIIASDAIESYLIEFDGIMERLTQSQ